MDKFIESNTSVEALDLALMSQKEDHLRDPYPEPSVRRDRMTRLLALVKENSEEIENAICEDFGYRSKDETYAFEVLSSVEEIRHAIKNFKKWMRREKRPAALMTWPARAEIIRQPLGVVGIMVPWNYPLYLAVSPLVGALSAGNRVMIKMSEYTPRFSALFAQLIAIYFAPQEVFVALGGSDVAQAFASKGFDHLLFTGSTAVGRQVMRAAAENLTPVTLELGGKSPTIICDDVDIEKVARSILFGKLANVGQTCVAPDYVLLPAQMEQAFLVAARKVVHEFYPTLECNPDYSCVINERQMRRLARYVQDATDKGAAIHPLHDEKQHAGSRKMVPLAVTRVTDGMLVMCEEIFGPLLPLLTYSSFEEALAYVNRHAKPLALYLFTHDKLRIERVLNHTASGGVVVNGVMLHVIQHDLPFGGVGPSGVGQYHGKEGFDTFSKLKGVMHQRALNGAFLMYPPRSNGRLRRLAKFIIG
ncbi:aldehyde dehydrogenase family protein [Rugamonas sp. FT82W]|uniref:Aldehyde dehydrogenase n=1 Tax=Duganella vulcania TaxID=2692166 RepID=A0A845GER3_9BURK|nr:coniferyl aldehyde dehydrogenase [Duganella vulcania]MYM91468.1 aldehyde dehydrogenase family protein [Duganella vulcania]